MSKKSKVLNENQLAIKKKNDEYQDERLFKRVVNASMVIIAGSVVAGFVILTIYMVNNAIKSGDLDRIQEWIVGFLTFFGGIVTDRVLVTIKKK